MRSEVLSKGFATGGFWRKAAVRGAILESAAEGKTIAAKRGSRGALELWPTIEQGTNWPPNLVPVYNFLSGQIQASGGERVLTARTPNGSKSRACFGLCVAAIESRRSGC